MWRFMFIAFLVAHGAVHLAIWTPSPSGDAPFDPTKSWLLGNQRAIAVVVAVIVGLILIGAGLGLWARSDWRRQLAVAGLIGSLALMIVFFNPWYSLIQTINAALIVALLWWDWPSVGMVGA